MSQESHTGGIQAKGWWSTSDILEDAHIRKKFGPLSA